MDKVYLIIFLLHPAMLPGQQAAGKGAGDAKIDTLCHTIQFAKIRKFWFSHPGRVVEIGKFKNWDARTYFLDGSLPPKERAYKNAGMLLYKFEKYCKKNNIYYNRKALKRYRGKACVAGFFFIIANFALVPVAIDANNYWRQSKSPSGNFPGLVEYLTGSPNAPFLWALLPAEISVGALMLSKAEKKLVKEIFVPEPPRRIGK